ncbi:MAG: virulence protein RhuM/Fic/DOC family protein [Bacteroidota bacterium]
MKNKSENKGEVIIYKTEGGREAIDVHLENETVWLNQSQMAILFGRDRVAITQHIGNIFKEKELQKKSVCKDFLHTAADGKTYKTQYYNLDVVISVGYRVKSKRGTQFRIWATNVLRDHLVKGYTVNKKALARTTASIAELQKTIALVTSVRDKKLSSDEAQGLLTIIKQYADTWTTLEAYDSKKLQKRTSSQQSISLTPGDVREKLAALKKELIRKGEASDLFAAERDHGIEQILGAIDQTFGGQELYPSIEEKAAHIFYFTIKDHPFSDGNKRSGAFLFLEYLRRNNALFKKDRTVKINDTALTALALLIAESDPKEKEQMIALITNLLKD